MIKITTISHWGGTSLTTNQIRLAAPLNQLLKTKSLGLGMMCNLLKLRSVKL